MQYRFDSITGLVEPGPEQTRQHVHLLRGNAQQLGLGPVQHIPLFDKSSWIVEDLVQDAQRKYAAKAVDRQKLGQLPNVTRSPLQIPEHVQGVITNAKV